MLSQVGASRDTRSAGMAVCSRTLCESASTCMLTVQGSDRHILPDVLMAMLGRAIGNSQSAILLIAQEIVQWLMPAAYLHEHQLIG